MHISLRRSAIFRHIANRGQEEQQAKCTRRCCNTGQAATAAVAQEEQGTEADRKAGAADCGGVSVVIIESR